jgi:diadenosine tetraphosphate (Ap4A) HIT family hydrolase
MRATGLVKVFDPRLAEDCALIAEWDLCSVLLMKDATYPWCILVPRRAEISEIYHLSAADQQQLSIESARLAETLMTLFDGHSMNIAALGNVVAQLHIHHVVRYRHDPTWPAPVWGAQAVQPYSEEALQQRIESIRQALGDG